MAEIISRLVTHKPHAFLSPGLPTFLGVEFEVVLGKTKVSRDRTTVAEVAKRIPVLRKVLEEIDRSKAIIGLHFICSKFHLWLGRHGMLFVGVSTVDPHPVNEVTTMHPYITTPE